MKHAIIVSGKIENAFNQEAMGNVIDGDGEVNWHAAFAADPGVVRCPKCSEFYWAEASVLECPECHVQFGHGVAVNGT